MSLFEIFMYSWRSRLDPYPWLVDQKSTYTLTFLWKSIFKNHKIMAEKNLKIPHWILFRSSRDFVHHLKLPLIWYRNIYGLRIILMYSNNCLIWLKNYAAARYQKCPNITLYSKSQKNVTKITIWKTKCKNIHSVKLHYYMNAPKNASIQFKRLQK